MGYTVNGKEYDYDSSKNQRILDKLVDREVYCLMTAEMEYMLSKVYDGDDKNPFSEEDLEDIVGNRYVCGACGEVDDFEKILFSDLEDTDFESNDEEMPYRCPVCGCEYDNIEEAKDCCSAEENLYRCETCGEIYSEREYETLDIEQPEVFGWWAVSKWFGEKLKEQGCVVIDAYCKAYWGRETTGQSISLDYCVKQIAKDMGILEGMEHEWRV